MVKLCQFCGGFETGVVGDDVAARGVSDRHTFAVVLAKARTHTARSIDREWYWSRTTSLRQITPLGNGSWLSPGRPGNICAGIMPQSPAVIASSPCAPASRPT